MSDGMRFERRMSDMDALMWGIEKDPLLRSTIVAVAVLDQAPDRARLLDKIERGTRLIPRLRQRAISPPLGVAPPRWVPDPNFDLNYHLRFVNAPGDGSLRDLLDMAAPLAMQGFDRARPLWEFTVVEGLADGKAALIQKIHHSVTDGVGGIKIALMLLDAEREPALDTSPLPALEEPETTTPFGLFREGLDHERRRQFGIARRAIGTAANFLRDIPTASRTTVEAAASLGRLLAPAFEPLSPIMGARSLSVRFDVITAPLGETKAAAKTIGGHLNDAFVAAVAGGLARYHERMGSSVEALRMTMPINIRTGDGEVLAGNQFVPARFPVPMNIADPAERMSAIQVLVGEARAEPGLAFTEPVAGVLNRLPTSVTTQLFGGMLKGIDFVTSNVPGAPFAVFLAGGRLESNFAFGPLSGSAVNITLLSYLDDLHIGINSDPAAVTDPELLCECLQEGFEEIRKLA